ncbi:hypothetical protein ACFV0O_32475 [Kitasatospora sp. NPDC059577]|uniref:hypothetical protein n=1 Tax=unclassified Kitasatospora TaxID=2633591 RepID=UPI0036791891
MAGAWDFLAAQIEGTDHFSKPVSGSDEDMVPSGRSIIALLNALRRTAHNGVDGDSGIETWALAVTSYERIAAVINHTRPADGAAGADSWSSRGSSSTTGSTAGRPTAGRTVAGRTVAGRPTAADPRGARSGSAGDARVARGWCDARGKDHARRAVGR